ncbi:hypothetical protein GGX14DRAFT_375628 [Mycena pura]|uniref:Uncharacterized protein n=1 Tax=Mycena pura TaxID=153505 RepID=A0AAD6Y923_9AGAR|nr:hypothetical protein GGX14DRAFT_375628 [Mycena pura]
MLFLPHELVREIIAYFFTVSSSEELRVNTKPTWSLVHPLSVASQAYRALLLEAWFRVLFTTSPSDFHFLRDPQNFPEIRNSWTRELHCVPTYLRLYRDWDFTGFRRLQTIRFDHPVLPRREGRLFRFLDVPSSTVELDLRGLIWPNPYVLGEIAHTFPSLTTLHLSHQRSIWCGLCHTCSDVRFVDPVPPKLVYREGLGLPIHYARELSSMQHLRTVCITLSYSTGIHIVFDPEDPTKDLWSGECDSCVGMMYGDVEFLARWTARKRGLHPGFQGEDYSRRVYIKPPALEMVEWTFWRTNDADIDIDEESEEDDDEEPDDPVSNDTDVEA